MALQKLKAVCAETALGRSSLYELIRRGEFPKPVRIGKRAVAWRSEDIDKWIESRPSVDDS